MKKRINIKKSLACSLAVFQVASMQVSVNACTTFATQTQNGSRVVYKGLDRTLAHGHVLVNRRGVQKHTLPIIELTINEKLKDYGISVKSHQWVSQYASLTFNQGGISFPYGGINEKKLSVDVLSLADDTTYPFLDNEGKADFVSKPVISETEWAQYILDTSSTVDEAVENANKVQAQKIAKGLHYMICDSSHQCSVFEYIKGKLVVSKIAKGDTPVLSNTVYSKQKHLEDLMASDISGFAIAAQRITYGLPKRDTKGNVVELTQEEQTLIEKENNELVQKFGVHVEIVNALRNEDDRRPLLAKFMLRFNNQKSTRSLVEKINEAVQLWDTRWNIGYSLDENKVYFRRFLKEDGSKDLSEVEMNVKDVFAKIGDSLDCSENDIQPYGFNMDQMTLSTKVAPEMTKISNEISIADSSKVLKGEGFPEGDIQKVQYLLMMNYQKNYSCKK